MWEAKVFAPADVVAEMNWKDKVTPDQGDLIIMITSDAPCYSTTICKLVDIIPALRESDWQIPN